MGQRLLRISPFVDLAILAGVYGLLLNFFDPGLLLTGTVPTGGDTASWQGVASHLAETLIPEGRLTGWDMGNFCGYPNFSFYFLPPFLLAVIPHLLTGISLAICLKWAIMSGIFLLPVMTFAGLKAMGYRFPVPALGTAGAVLFLFNESYTMFGANALSTFSGEFCYMFAFAVFACFMGTFYNGVRTGRRVVTNGLMLGLIGLSHLFVFLPAMCVWLFFFLKGRNFSYLFRVALWAFVVMAFWILPLVAYRHPYTTPIYMIWSEFTGYRQISLGVAGILLVMIPGFSLYSMGHYYQGGGGREKYIEFARIAGIGSFLAVGAFLIVKLHLRISGAVSGTGPGTLLQRPGFILSVYGPVFIAAACALVFSKKIKRVQYQVAMTRVSKKRRDRFFLWAWLVLGCATLYFSAHFLQVPDIRFFPPLNE